MSRHRRVRNMSYGEDDDYDEYGRSVEEEAPLSPNTAAQFMYHRDQHENLSLSSYFDKKETTTVTTPVSPLATTATVASPQMKMDKYIPSTSGENREGHEPMKVKATPKSQAKVGFITHTREDSERQGNSKSPVRSPSPQHVLSTPTAPVHTSPAQLTNPSPAFSRSVSKAKHQTVDVLSQYQQRESVSKAQINLVVVGHVDAGKSTLMGHLLYLLGNVSKRAMHKNEVESQKIGKGSFAYAWVLDETGEERTRGITMDVGQQEFETEHRRVILLDAPGHRDFIPNMITGAAQADVSILVVNAATGEFEAGFESGGQTREHAMLVRSFGVKQMTVAINKMDTVQWSENRFYEVINKLKLFLKQAGFRESDVSYIPCSGLTGENLVKKATVPELTVWYSGPTLLATIDQFTPPSRPVEKPFRCCVADIFKAPGSGFNIAGRIDSGHTQLGETISVLPVGETATVKGIVIGEKAEPWAVAGDQVIMTIHGVEMIKLSIGNVLSSTEHPAKITSRIQARIITFNISVPITNGFPVIMHYLSVNEPATVTKLISVLHKGSGEVIKRRPRCLSRNCTAVIQLDILRPVCMELYQDCRELGRFMLRSGGSTTAAGVVMKVCMCRLPLSLKRLVENPEWQL